MSAEPMLGVPRDPGLHAPLGLRRQVEFQEIVDSPNLLDRIRDQSGVGHVGERLRTDPIADGHRALHHPHLLVRPLPPHLPGIDPIAEDPAGVGQHAAERGQHAQRIPVRMDDLRVGKYVEERIQVFEVMRRLAQPTTRLLPEEQLNHATEVAIGGAVIDVLEPPRVTGQVLTRLRRRAQQ